MATSLSKRMDFRTDYTVIIAQYGIFARFWMVFVEKIEKGCYHKNIKYHMRRKMI
jgi:hypothetical protein